MIASADAEEARQARRRRGPTAATRKQAHTSSRTATAVSTSAKPYERFVSDTRWLQGRGPGDDSEHGRDPDGGGGGARPNLAVEGIRPPTPRPRWTKIAASEVGRGSPLGRSRARSRASGRSRSRRPTPKSAPKKPATRPNAEKFRGGHRPSTLRAWTLLALIVREAGGRCRCFLDVDGVLRAQSSNGPEDAAPCPDETRTELVRLCRPLRTRPRP